MTEEEWARCTDPQAMLAFLGEAGERQLRLFVVACSRHLWQLLTIDSIRRAVIVAERFADRLASTKDLADARSRAIQKIRHAVHQHPFSPRHFLWVGAYAADGRHPTRAWGPSPVKWPEGEAKVQAALLRDIFDPFRPASLLSPPCWPGPTASSSSWPRPPTSTARSRRATSNRTASRSSRTPWRTPAARTPGSWLTCVRWDRT